MTKSVVKNVNLDLSLYFNEETGESLASELVGNGMKVSVREETDTVTIDKGDNFGFINYDTLAKVSQILNASDLGHVLRMFPLTKTDMNMVYNHSVPHSNETLQSYLEISNRNKFYELMKRLIKAGVLYQIKGNINGAVRVVYIMNPFLANKRRTFNSTLVKLFKDFK